MAIVGGVKSCILFTLLLTVVSGVLARNNQNASVEPVAPLTEKARHFPPKDSHAAQVIRGEIVFQSYCVLCHGVNADGHGRAAKLFNPPPANLRKSDKNTLYKVLIITRGGAAMGRSPAMPQWSEELTTEQITDVVGYLNSIAEHPSQE